MPATLTRPNVQLLHDAARPLRGLDKGLRSAPGNDWRLAVRVDRRGIARQHEFYETRAVEPLDPPDSWHGGEPPETFPTGL